MSTTSSTPAPAPATKEGWLQKVWTWITGEVTHVENGIADIFGSEAAQNIEAAGKALISSNFGPLITAALADATDVATGQMSVSKAVTSLVSLFKAEGKTLTSQAALQVIAVAQNSLPANAQTVTVTQ